MPAPQLHLTFGELVAHHADISPSVRAAVAREPVYTHLGSIFHDMPYYGNMIAEAIRYAARRPAIDAPWAYRMHCMRPDRFVASYIASARTTEGLTRDERLALIAGLLSHCALDLTLHPLVNWIARRDVRLHGGHETFNHRVTEKYHSLFFHLERFGEDTIGSPGFKLKTQVVKQGSLGGPVEPQILHFMRGAYAGAFGEAPAPERWSTWARNFRHFGLLMSTKICSRNSKKKGSDQGVRERYFSSESFDFNTWYAHSERRLAELVNLGFAYFEAGDFSESARDAFCLAARIDDLAEPNPTGLPTLAELPAFVPRKPRLVIPLGRRTDHTRESRDNAA